MPVTITWQQIALRLFCTVVAGLLIGIDREEKGRAAGMRTNVLVCLAASIAMIEANSLMGTIGKAPNSFVTLDLARYPLGILDGMGFIGAGAVLRKGNRITGLTSAATLWIVTVLGLSFGAGLIWLGIAGTVVALLTLSGLKLLERRMQADLGRLSLVWDRGALSESQIRDALKEGGMHVASWSFRAESESAVRTIECELRWHRAVHSPFPPKVIEHLLSLPGVLRVDWNG